jgi:hypothetical protein
MIRESVTSFTRICVSTIVRRARAKSIMGKILRSRHVGCRTRCL